MFHFYNYGRKGKSPSNTPTYLVTFASLGQVVKETSEDVIKAAEADCGEDVVEAFRNFKKIILTDHS